MKTWTLFVIALLAPVAAFAGQGSMSPGYYICESMEGNTSYFSDIFLGPGDASLVGKAFTQMLASKYGYTGRIHCPRANNEPDVLKLLQNQHKPYAEQRAQQGRRVVETGWTYNGAPSLSLPRSFTEIAPKPAPAPPHPANDDEPPAASKPAAAPHAAPPPAAAPPKPEGPMMYAYCYAYGTPKNGGASAKQRLYVSQVFQLPASERPNSAFEKFLSPLHPTETIDASCLAPGAIEVATKGRQTVLDSRRKQGLFEVVEVEWKR